MNKNDQIVMKELVKRVQQQEKTIERLVDALEKTNNILVRVVDQQEILVEHSLAATTKKDRAYH